MSEIELIIRAVSYGTILGGAFYAHRLAGASETGLPELDVPAPKSA